MSTLLHRCLGISSAGLRILILSGTLLFSACEAESPVEPNLDALMARVHAGNSFSCGLVEDGRALCWGNNDSGQLGSNLVGSSRSALPNLVSEELRFRELSTRPSGRHVCGVTDSGDAYCWGRNDFGQIGVGSLDEVEGPKLVVGGLKFASVAAGWRASCGVTTTGDAYCWGRGEWGQLGDGLATRSTVPTPVTGGHRFQKLDIGSNNLVCGLTTDGKILCWGLDRAGSLGSPSHEICVRNDGLRLACATTPQLIVSDELFLDVTAGSSFACGLNGYLRAFCWGRNEQGQLGSLTSETCSQDFAVATPCGRTPRPVFGTLRFASLSAGLRHVCGVTLDGDAYCWGQNVSGGLGDGDVGRSSPMPTRVLGGLTFRRVSAGDQHSCGEEKDGTWYCWGSNQWGQLGTGDTNLWLLPTPVVTGL